MTKEEAIKKMESMKQTFIDLHTPQQMKKKESKRVIEAYDMAIKALEFDIDKHDEEVIKNTVDTLWGEPCEDCVSRAEVLDYIKSSKEWLYRNENFDVEMQTSFEDIEMAIKDLPSVQPKQKVGRWIVTPTVYIGTEKVSTGHIRCSECGVSPLCNKTTNYCPNCGAKIREVKA